MYAVYYTHPKLTGVVWVLADKSGKKKKSRVKQFGRRRAARRWIARWLHKSFDPSYRYFIVHLRTNHTEPLLMH